MSIVQETIKSISIEIEAETNLNSMAYDEPNTKQRCYAHRLKINIPTLKKNIPAQLNVRSYDPTGANALKIKQAYKDPESIDNTRGMFVHRNLGVTICASAIEDLGGGRYRLTFADPDVDGIVNGNTTYNALLDAIDELKEEGKTLPKEHVIFNILVGLSPDSLPEIIEGVSFADKVEDMSIANARGYFDWLKKALDTTTVHSVGDPTEKISSKIAWEEHAQQNPTANHILKCLTAMNVKMYGPWDWDELSNEKKLQMPTDAHNKNNNIVNSTYLKKDKNQNFKYFNFYQDMRLIVNDIIALHDYIVQRAHIWSPDYTKGDNIQKAKSVFEKKNKEITQNNLLNKLKDFSEDTPVLMQGYAFMILASLRTYLTVNDDGLIVWKNGYNLSKILAHLEDGLGKDLVSTIREQIYPIQDKDGNGNFTGKIIVRANSVTSNKANWNTLYITARGFKNEIEAKQYQQENQKLKNMIVSK
jgi:hypothetical protein